MFKKQPKQILGNLPVPPAPKAGVGRSFWRILWAGLPSLLFKLVVLTRHKLYDSRIFRSEKGALPCIVIGNLTVGGTGKTPHVKALLEALRLSSQSPDAPTTRWAVLSRGYRRSTKGFRWVGAQSKASEVGDEPLEIALRFPKITVAVCESRPEGVARIAAARHDPGEAEHLADAVLLDDAFQHRALRPDLSIVLVDVKQPVDLDAMLPLGRLRDLPSRLSAADVVILTRCERQLVKGDLRLWRDRLGVHRDQLLLHTAMRPKGLKDMRTKRFAAWPRRAVLVSGIANPQSFVEFVENGCRISARFIYPDHHPFSAEDLDAWRSELAQEAEAIITTEKDAARIRELDGARDLSILVVPVGVQFLDEHGIDQLVGKIQSAVAQRQAHSV
jgi:tetraacyldisaccharide 4'-kinase